MFPHNDGLYPQIMSPDKPSLPFTASHKAFGGTRKVDNAAGQCHFESVHLGAHVCSEISVFYPFWPLFLLGGLIPKSMRHQGQDVTTGVLEPGACTGCFLRQLTIALICHQSHFP